MFSPQIFAKCLQPGPGITDLLHLAYTVAVVIVGGVEHGGGSVSIILWSLVIVRVTHWGTSNLYWSAVDLEVSGYLLLLSVHLASFWCLPGSEYLFLWLFSVCISRRCRRAWYKGFKIWLFFASTHKTVVRVCPGPCYSPLPCQSWRYINFPLRVPTLTGPICGSRW